MHGHDHARGERVDLGPKRKSVGIQKLWEYAGLTGKAGPDDA